MNWARRENDVRAATIGIWGDGPSTRNFARANTANKAKDFKMDGVPKNITERLWTFVLKDVSTCMVESVDWVKKSEKESWGKETVVPVWKGLCLHIR